VRLGAPFSRLLFFRFSGCRLKTFFAVRPDHRAIDCFLWAPLPSERSPPLDPASWPPYVSLPLTYHAVPDIA